MNPLEAAHRTIEAQQVAGTPPLYRSQPKIVSSRQDRTLLSPSDRRCLRETASPVS